MLDRYKNLHLWMLLPLIISQIAIFFFYWPEFSTNKWEIHIHYWLVTIWYILMVIQPYLISKGSIKQHRTLGILGFVLAGGVIFTGWSLLDIPLRIIDNMDPNAPGPPAFFFYGIIIAEFLEMVAFVIAIVMAVLYRHQVAEHAWWLIASVFYMIAPAVGRGLIIFWRTVLPPEDFSPFFVFISLEVIYLLMFFPFAIKFGKIKHPATYLALLLVLIRFFSRPLAAQEGIQEFIRSIIVY